MLATSEGEATVFTKLKLATAGAGPDGGKVVVVVLDGAVVTSEVVAAFDDAAACEVPQAANNTAHKRKYGVFVRKVTQLS